jgi:ABC-2 type transport system permease protein
LEADRLNGSTYWSVRRELWENRSLYIAPLLVAAVAFFGFMISTIGMPGRRRGTMLLETAKRRALIQLPYDVIATIIIVTALIVGFFYCLDALYGERRDRSILFWKSLPVSDRTAVVSKAVIPLAILPALAFVITVITQILMLLWSTAVLLPSGQAMTTWQNVNLFEKSTILLYGLVTVTLWYAPIYAWLLLLSAWARRATFLWAVLPPFAIGVFEQITFQTTHFAQWLRYRFMGHFDRSFDVKHGQHIDSLAQLTPGTFLSTPGLWLGLVFAAAFLAAAVRMRRYREPI